MTPYRKGGQGRTMWYVAVPTPTGQVKRSTGTADKPTAKAMERMVQELGPKGARRWDLLGPVAEGRLSLAALYDAYRARDLDGLVARLTDVDLAGLLPAWRRWMADRVRPETAARYTLYLATLHGGTPETAAPWWRSTLTTPRVVQWLASREVSGPTKRKYAAALASFVAFAQERGLLGQDPLAGVSLPPAKYPEPVFLEREEVDRLVAGAPAPYADAIALLYATGAEVSAALAVRRRDVDLHQWLVRMPGTKTYNRDRVAIIAEWARPRIEARCRGLLPHALLFEGIQRNWLSKVHARTLREQGLRHLKLHAARNHWAVRAIRGGWSLEAVARQLGNTPEMVARIYGRFVLSLAELARLEHGAELEAQRRAVERTRGTRG